MSEYIDREALIEALNENAPKYYNALINDIIMAQPVKDSKTWGIEVGIDVQRCDKCSKYLRPCEVNGKPALFHRWVDNDYIYIHTPAPKYAEKEVFDVYRMALPILNEDTTQVVRRIAGIVEFEDGTVEAVEPGKIKFLDRGPEV